MIKKVILLFTPLIILGAFVVNPNLSIHIKDLGANILNTVAKAGEVNIFISGEILPLEELRRIERLVNETINKVDNIETGIVTKVTEKELVTQVTEVIQVTEAIASEDLIQINASLTDLQNQLDQIPPPLQTSGGSTTIIQTLNPDIINTGLLTVDSELTLDGSTISTVTSNLTLNSAGGTTTIDDNVSVTGDLTVDGTITGTLSLSAASSASGPFEITSNGTTTNQLKLTDSSVGKTFGVSVNDGDFQIRASNSTNTFASEDVVFSIASQSGGVSIGAPLRPTLVGTLDTSSALGIYVSGKYAYVADSTDGLLIIDISNPASPSLTATLSLTSAVDVYVSGKYAYVADSTVSGNLRVIDISNPSSPTLVASLTGTNTQGIYVSGKYAYITENTDGLRIIDISNPSSPTPVATLDTTGARDIYVSGKYAYVADASAGLRIIDVSNPSSPTLTATLDTTSAQDIYVSGKYAYVADSTAGLRIINVSNPSSPTLTATLDTTDTRGIYVSGKYAYITDLAAGLRIIDVSNPSSPTLTATLDTTLAADVYVSGKYAYVADGSAGLRIIDLGGFDTPTLNAGDINTSNIEITDNVNIGNDLHVQNGAVIGEGGLLVNGRIGISVASLSNNTASVSAADLFRISNDKGYLSGDVMQLDITQGDTQEKFTGNFQRFTLAGSNIFLVESSGAVVASGAAQFGGVATVSYSRFGTNTTSYSSFITAANDLLISGDLEVDGQVFFDGTSSASGTFELTTDGTVINQFKLTDSSVTKTVALSVNDGDFQIRLSSASNNFSDEYVAISIASQSGGIDIGAPSRPQVVGVISGTGAPNLLEYSIDTYISGRYAYVVTNTDDSLSIIDISNPASPSLVGTISGAGAPNFLNSATSVQVSGRYAYVTTEGEGSLTIIDVSDPTNPTYVENIPGLYSARDIYISGKYAFVTAGNGITSIDISNPASPKLMDDLDLGGPTKGLYVAGRYAYVTANTLNAIFVIDISNPSNLTNVGTLSGAGSPNFLGQPWDVYVSGKYAYVATFTDDSLTIIDVSDPTTPAFVGVINGAGSPNFLNGAISVQVSGKYAYVSAQAENAISIIDVSDPTAPTFVSKVLGTGSPNFLAAPRGAKISGKYLYVSTQTDNSLTIIDLGGLDTATLNSGNIHTYSVEVVDNVDIGNDLYIRGSSVIGRGLLINGGLGINVGFLSDNTASISTESLFRVSHARGYLSGDIIDIAAASSTSQEFFTGNFQRFTLAGSDIFLVESSGAVLASGAAQFGSAGAPTSVSYSRFGTGTTGNSNYISAADDLLISGDLEVIGSGSFNIASASQLFLGLQSSGAFALCHATNGAVGSEEVTDCSSGPTADYREMYPVEQSVEWGDIVVPDNSKFVITTELDTVSRLIKSSSANQTDILGVASNPDGSNDFNTIGYNIEDTDNPFPVALNGRVLVKVNLENGEVKVGDRITTSSTPGVGMKATDAGMVVGIALQSLDSLASASYQKVMVFVNPHWHGGSINDSGTLTEEDVLGEGVIFDLNILFGNIVKKFAEVFNIVFENNLINVANIISNKIQSKEICLEDICINKDQLKQLLENSSIPISMPIPTPSVTPEPSISPSPEPTESPSSTPEATISPSPEPTPTVTPTPEPTPEITPSPEPTPTVTPTPEPTPEVLPNTQIEEDVI